jgi:hypothetical protein
MKNRQKSAEKERAVQEVLIHMFRILLFAGKSEQEIQSCAQSCIEAAGKELQLLAAKTEGTDSFELATVLRAWHREGKYLTRQGYPRPLGYGGANGLKNLIGRFCEASKVDEIFNALRTADLIRKTNNSKWFPTRKHAVIPHLSSELLKHLSEGVSRLVETVVRNVNAENSEEVLFERSAKVRKFPVTAAAEFRSFVNAQAISFLGAVDDWMETQAQGARRTKSRKCTAGVFTFAFIDEMKDREPKLRRSPNANRQR